MNFDANGLFNPENKFWMFMDKIMNLCVIGFLWLLFSLPVVTAGAATTALFSYTLRMTQNEEGYIFKSFWNSFRENFVRSTMLWLCVAGIGLFLAVDLYACQFLPFGTSVRLGVRIVLARIGFVYFLTVLYVFPLTSAFSISFKKTVMDALIMSVGNLYVSVTILVIYGIFAVVSWFVPVLFMVWFALASYFASHFYHSVFQRYMPEDEENSNNSW